jgi:hypothetical protein
VQKEIIKRVSPDLENLDDLVDQAAKGALGYHVVRNCPFDCSSVPNALKRQVADLIIAFKSNTAER